MATGCRGYRPPILDGSKNGVCQPPTGSSPLRWAGFDEIKNRGRFGGHTIVRRGDGVRQRRLVSHHLDALLEVADEDLALGERPILQEVPEVRNVLRYLLGVGKGNPALLKAESRCRGLSESAVRLSSGLPIYQTPSLNRTQLPHRSCPSPSNRATRSLQGRPQCWRVRIPTAPAALGGRHRPPPPPTRAAAQSIVCVLRKYSPPSPVSVSTRSRCSSLPLCGPRTDSGPPR